MQYRAMRRPFWNWFAIEQIVVVLGFFVGGAAIGTTGVPAIGLVIWLAVLIWAWNIFVNGIHWRPERIWMKVSNTKPHIVEHADVLAKSVGQITNQAIGEEIVRVQLKQSPLDATEFLASGIDQLPPAFHVGRGFGVWHIDEIAEEPFAAPIPQTHYYSLLQWTSTKLNNAFDESDTKVFRCNGRLKGEEAILVEKTIGRGKTVWCVVRLGADGGGQMTHLQLMASIPRRWTWLDFFGVVPVVLFPFSVVFLPLWIVVLVLALMLGIIKGILQNSGKIVDTVLVE